MFSDWKYWPIVGPVIALFSSRKFLVALAAVLAGYGLTLSPELMTLILIVSTAVVGGGIAVEDAAAKRAKGKQS